ncbi:type II toxin-antitoxin system HicB family antitoxin [Pectobacterium versatile]|uniref:type II toxin-antitoxin system HicB family antitoxin n=1 Tax=Pectobacterium versatile TaxID=2488639 RepID=UPI000D003B0F|nr:type II toxin-antitoxin system HicB family antitoxin [Pectobacterium versatile]PRI21498.1 antitoxin HicB [Pectobacterium versatile]
MANILKYNGYFGSIETSLEDMVLHGRIECINDVVTYEANTLSELKAAFEEAVDDYLETCRLVGKNPDRPMSGSFNVRIGEDLHKRAYAKAKEDGINLNELVKKAIQEQLEGKKEYHIHIDKSSDTIHGNYGYDIKSQKSWQFNDSNRRYHDA